MSRALFIALVAALLGACHHDKPPVAPRMVIEKRPCVLEPPPPMVPGAVEYERPKEDGSTECAEGYVACLRRPAFIVLIRYLDDVYKWSRDAWTSCGPPPATKPPDAAPESAATPATGEIL